MSQDKLEVIPVPFHGDTITAIETPAGEFVAIKPICDRIGVSDRAQRKRVSADPERWGGTVMVLPSAGGVQETFCIPLNRVAAFLFTITVSRVKPEAREALRLYQAEAADVLDRHFRLRRADLTDAIAILTGQLAACHAEIVKANPRMAQIYYLWQPGEPEIRQVKPRGLSVAKWFDIVDRMQDGGMLTVAAASDTGPQTMAARMRELQRDLNLANAALAKVQQRDARPDKAVPPEPVPSDLEADLQRRAEKVGVSHA